jgi:hypothetical protein
MEGKESGQRCIETHAKKKPDDHLHQTRSRWWQRDLQSSLGHAAGGVLVVDVWVPEDDGKKRGEKEGKDRKKQEKRRDGYTHRRISCSRLTRMYSSPPYSGKRVGNAGHN